MTKEIVKVAELAHQYITSLEMWGTEHDEPMFSTWASMYGLKDTLARRVRRVVDEIFNTNEEE